MTSAYLPSPTSLLRRVKKHIGRALQFITTGSSDVVISRAGAARRRLLDGSNRSLRLVILVLLQTAVGLSRANASPKPQLLEGEARTLSLHSTSANFAEVDALKLVLAAVLVVFEARSCRSHGLSLLTNPWHTDEMESSPLQSPDHSRSEDGDTAWTTTQHTKGSYCLHLGTHHSNLAIASLSLLYALKAYLSLYIVNIIVHLELADPNVIHLTSLFVPLLSGVLMRIFFSWIFSHQQWLGILIQICGILSLESQYIQSTFSWLSIWMLFALALLTSFSCIATHYVYNLHDTITPHRLNFRLFAFGLSAHLSILTFSVIFTSSASSSLGSFNWFFPLILRSLIDIASLNMIFYNNAVMLGVATSLSTTIIVAYTTDHHSVMAVSNVLVAFLGFLAYTVGEAQRPLRTSNDTDKKSIPSRSLVFYVSFLLLVAFICLGCISFSSESATPVRDFAFMNSKAQTESLESPLLADLIYLPPTVLSGPPEPVCTRELLRSVDHFARERTYHEFDDVLLIVFFSHARYEVNLDYYKEVYAEFFPNMVFVGPRSREDKGFAHSYDVLVDSYESDEDLSDWRNYKMAGRMAHHMLYTVLTTPPYSTGCYKGFLWAPFDTLLNVPRLQLFDQTRMWYFSPWAEYVSNPAVGEEAWRNASSHAPPARVSPDPETDFEETYRGWWVDWWWGDPHFGIPVCKPAFERVPLELRERMALRFTHNATRFIGGSADTLYLPARLAANFTAVLGTFLETNCFLEIAVPTAVHLVVPEEEEILFVDHWWIWDPPFNASFVRNVWTNGMEVDTFHTFHWGDKDANGVWHAIPENIDDVRVLLRESAARQGIDWRLAPAQV